MASFTNSKKFKFLHEVEKIYVPSLSHSTASNDRMLVFQHAKSKEAVETSFCWTGSCTQGLKVSRFLPNRSFSACVCAWHKQY